MNFNPNRFFLDFFSAHPDRLRRPKISPVDENDEDYFKSYVEPEQDLCALVLGNCATLVPKDDG